MKLSRVAGLLPLIAISAFAQTGSVTNPAVAVATTIGATNSTTGVANAAVAVGPSGAVTVTAPTGPVGSIELPAATGETTITLDVGFGIRAVLPSRVTVPAGERLRVIAPQMDAGTSYIWTKNGQALPNAGGGSNVLILNSVTSGDAGAYACLFSTPATLPQPSQVLVLGVGPTDRLLNLSTRGNVGAGGDQGLVSGFVVAAGGQSKKLILRAVGPSLSLFGVTNPLRAPVLRIFDGSGRVYENGYAYLPIVGGLTYDADLAASLAKTGAFPLPAGTRDAVIMMPFIPGAYTAQITSGDGSAGSVLLEIYEVP